MSRRGPGRPKAPPKTALIRPAALSREVQQQILQFLAEGNFLDDSIRAAGISTVCFYHWRRRWQDEDPKALIYDDFFNSIKKAESLGITAHVRTIGQGAPGWQGSAWILERRYPRRWGKKEVIVIEGAKDVREMTDEQLDRARRRSRARG